MTHSEFRVLILKTQGRRPWMAICQDRFPLIPDPESMFVDDNGWLPTVFGYSEDEVRDKMDIAIQERLQDLNIKEYRFICFKTTFKRK